MDWVRMLICLRRCLRCVPPSSCWQEVGLAWDQLLSLLLLLLLLLLILLLIGQLLRADTVLGDFYLPLISLAVHYANGDTRRMLAAPSRVFGRPGSSSRCGAATGPTSTRAARARARVGRLSRRGLAEG